MRALQRGFVWAFSGMSAAALAACGGGSASAPMPTTGTSSSTPVTTPLASVTQNITASAGGAVTVKSAAGTSLTVAVAGGALAADAAVTVSLYSGSPGGTLPSGASFLSGFTIDTGGVALYKRLSVSETLPGAPPSGTLHLGRLSSATKTYGDVDTATFAAGSVHNDDNAKYVGLSAAAASPNAYAFYAVGGASAASTPPPIGLTVTVAGAGPYAAGSTIIATASGADANGNPYIFAPTFSLSPAAFGTIAAAGANPFAASVALGAAPGTGSIVVTDARTTTTASTAVRIATDLPLAAGQNFAYAGTSTQSFARLLPAPMPVVTTTVTVAQNGIVKDGQTFNGVSGLFDASETESDVTALQTSTSQTDTFYGFSTPASDGSYKLLEQGSTWADDNGNTLTYTYPTPLTIGLLPERNGAAWSNGAAVSIAENDSTDAQGAAFFSQRVYAADGSYNETTTYPAGYGGTTDHGSIIENSDGSGISATPNLEVGTASIVFSAPAIQPDGTYALPFTAYAVANPGPNDVPLNQGLVAAWFTVPVTLYHETDTNLGTKPVPSACNVPASLATSATQIERSIARVDTILGYSEQQTTDEFHVPAIGTVCLQMHDVQTAYYNFGGDNLTLLSSSPVQTTTVVQTLALQSGASVESAKRQTTAVAPLSTHAIVAAQMVFNREVEHVRSARRAQFTQALHAASLRHQGGTR